MNSLTQDERSPTGEIDDARVSGPLPVGAASAAAPATTAHVRGDSSAPAPQVLVVGNGSTSSHNAARRAALVARQHGWPLRVLHAERDRARLSAAQEAAEQLCKHLQERLGISAVAEVSSGDLVKEVVRRTDASCLLVIGSLGDNALSHQVGGAAMDRLIRLSRTPTLVVRRQVDAAFAHGAPDAGSRGRYQRVLACVDLDAAAAQVVAASNWLAPGSHMEAFHAVSARAASVPWHRKPGEEPSVLALARSNLAALLSPSAAPACIPSVAFGRPVDAVLARERAVSADLVVIGKRQRGLLADFFLGEVTRRVLTGGSADVLVLPRLRESSAGVSWTTSMPSPSPG